MRTVCTRMSTQTASSPTPSASANESAGTGMAGTDCCWMVRSAPPSNSPNSVKVPVVGTMRAKLVAPPNSRVSRSTRITSSSTGTSDAGVRMARRPAPPKSVPAATNAHIHHQPPPEMSGPSAIVATAISRNDAAVSASRWPRESAIGSGCIDSPIVPGRHRAPCRLACLSGGRHDRRDARASASRWMAGADPGAADLGRLAHSHDPPVGVFEERRRPASRWSTVTNATAGSKPGRRATRVAASCSSGSTSTANPGMRASRARAGADEPPVDVGPAGVSLRVGDSRRARSSSIAPSPPGMWYSPSLVEAMPPRAGSAIASQRTW